MIFELKKTTGNVTHSFKHKANSLIEIEQYRDNNFQGYTIQEISEVTKSTEQILYEQVRFGEQLVFELKVDVRKNNGKINPNFMTVITLLREGELDDVITEINKLSSGIMSAELKNKYISTITNFLNNQ